MDPSDLADVAELVGDPPAPELTAPDSQIPADDQREDLTIEPDLPIEDSPPVPDEEREMTLLERDETDRVRRQDARRQARIAAQAKPAVRTYLVGAKAIRVDGVWRQPGEEVPEAKSWLRVDSWVAARRIIPVPA